MRTRIARTTVAFFFAFVIATPQYFTTGTSTSIRVLYTVNDILLFSTITTSHFFLLTRLANSRMTISLTFVLLTIQSSFTLLTTLIDQTILTTFHHSLAFSALTFHQTSFVLTWGTFSSVAHKRAGVITI